MSFVFFGTPTMNELTYDAFNKFLGHFSHYKHNCKVVRGIIFL